MTNTPGHKTLTAAQAEYVGRIKETEKEAVQVVQALEASGDSAALLKGQADKNRALVQDLPAEADQDLAAEADEYLKDATTNKNPARARRLMRIGYMLLTRAATNPENAL